MCDMSALRMHYPNPSPAGFPVPRNLLFSNLEEKAALVWPPGSEGTHNKAIGSGGVGGGSSPPNSQHGPPQNLVHWMSVMAEHMQNNNPHHADPVHYMWNGVESKMNNGGGIDQQNSPSPMNKGGGHVLDDRLDGRLVGGGGGGGGNGLGDLGHNMAHSAALYARSNGSTSSSSPPTASTPSMLIVPQPINAAKMPPTPPSLGHNTQSNGSRKYQCKMCPQIFGSKADLQLHTQYHMREAKPYKCSQCSKAFANSSYLSQHTRIHLGIKPYRCDICQRKFTQLSHLQQHIRTHTGDKPYKCRHPGCNKAFSQLSNLQSHSRCHQSDKPFKCNSCYKCFADEASLLDHIPKHKESKHLKTHICQYCGKSYTQETYLQKHMQKHAERPDKRPSLAQGLRQDHPYWPKHENAHLESIETRMSESCLQSSIDPSRHLTASVNRDHNEHHRQEELRHTPAHVSSANMSYESLGVKTSSAFTPIQTSMLPISGGGQLSMAASSSQRYFPYDPIGFQKPHSQMPPMDVKPNHFPNQLISLNQIRNYVHQPTMSSDLLQLKDKNIAQ